MEGLKGKTLMSKEQPEKNGGNTYDNQFKYL